MDYVYMYLAISIIVVLLYVLLGRRSRGKISNDKWDIAFANENFLWLFFLWWFVTPLFILFVINESIIKWMKNGS